MRDPETPEEIVDALAPGVADVLLHRHVREERVVLEHEADSAALGREVDPGLAVEQHRAVELDPPALGRVRPEIARSTVVLPAPDGPTSATVSRPTARSTATRKARRGTSIASRSASTGEEFDEEEHAGADDDEQRADGERRVEVDVQLGVDGERQRLGDALEAAGEEERRAELAQPAGEGARRRR